MRRQARLEWRLFFSYIAIVFGALLAAGWYSLHTIETFLVDETVAGLTERARLLHLRIDPFLDPLDPAAVDSACKQAGAASHTRYTVVLPAGAVVGDSSADPTGMENHASRPEIAGALAQGIATARRFSTTLRESVLYVAVAPPKGDGMSAVVRAAVPLTRVNGELARIRTRFVGIGALIAAAALAVTLAISRRHGRKVRALQQGAARFAQGDLSHRVAAPDSEELAGIAESLNRMAAEIQSRMQALADQRNQLEVVLSGMQEGVIAVDHEGRVVTVNPAAARMFALPPGRTVGRSLQEVARHHAIQRLVDRALRGEGPAAEDLTVFQDGERTLHVTSSPLHGTGPTTFGALVVFSDVTQLRRLENMRRDFVANVSHELKTPLTAIKGFVETLCLGQATPAESERFLGIIARHVERLNAIIDDLLMLSRLEEPAGRSGLRREPTRLREVMDGAVQVCRAGIEAKRIRVRVIGGEALAEVDPALLEQAVVNLVDNAVKYSDAGREVELSAAADGPEIRIAVRDHGIGIDPKHHPRIFERFYRVDKARSRAAGGTGLGLSIVKHIAQAHGGRVEVESAPGEGSRFTIHLPRTP